MESAKSWLRSTFLYVRLKHNPAHYKLEQKGEPKDINRSLEEICEKNLNLLSESSLIFNKESGLRCSELGDAMARYYIKFGTMQMILALEGKARVPEVVSKLLSSKIYCLTYIYIQLLVLSQSEEFKDIRFRGGERGLYKELNKIVKYPIKTDLSNASHKTFLLIQVGSPVGSF